MFEQLPKETATIFNLLSKGHFICSVSRKHKALYEVLSRDEYFEGLKAYFDCINFRLEQGNGYFYFSRGLKEGETLPDLEERLIRLNKYVDLLAFFSSLSEKFSAGVRFRPSKIAEECVHNPLLKSKLQSLRGTESTSVITEEIRKIAEDLQKESYVERLDDSEENYLVLNSYHYLEQMVCTINPNNDEQSASA